MMKLLPIDTVPVSCVTWDEIKGKAHLYKTARIAETGEYVSIRGIEQGPVCPLFRCFVPSLRACIVYATTDLCDFCL